VAVVENRVISVRVFVIEQEARIDMFMRRIQIAGQKLRRPGAVMGLKEVAGVVFLPGNAKKLRRGATPSTKWSRSITA